MISPYHDFLRAQNGLKEAIFKYISSLIFFSTLTPIMSFPVCILMVRMKIFCVYTN